ncbi:hypothetical protein ACOMHN_025372 [Nucella lapillus]
MTSRSRRQGRAKDRLLEEGEDVEGVSNPSMDSETEAAYQTFSQTEGESSAAELAEEAADAEHLVKDLKTRRRQRRKALSKLTSPKDDVVGELKTMRSTSRQRVEDTIREEAALSADEATMLTAATEDGISALPPEEVEPTPPTEGEITATEMPSLETDTERFTEPPESARSVKEEVKEEVPSAPTPAAEEEAPKTSLRKGGSLRERMQQRLAKAKEEAEGEIEKEARDERDRQRSLRSKQPESKYDMASQEELERTTEEKQRQLRMRWQKRGQGQLTEKEVATFMPTPEEAFDFFTRVWEPEPEEKKDEEKKDEEKEEGEEGGEPKPSTSKPEGEEGEEEPTEEGEEGKKEEDAEKAEDKKPLLDDADYDEEGYGPTAVRRADVTPPDKLLEAEEKLLFIPPLIAKPATEKVDEEQEPRFLEDEGFYVGVRPEVASRNKNKMENRLLREPSKGKKWFGEDGELIVFPDPLRPSPSRPPMPEEVEPYLETVFKKAVMREFDSRYIDGVLEGGGHYQLDVDVNSITFSHHHMFSREHVIATRLSQLYAQYTTRHAKNLARFLTDKLRALKASSLHLQEYILAHKGEMSVVDRTNYEKRLQDYKFEIRQTRSMRDREEQLDRNLMKNIIRSWKEMRSVRESQRCTNTPLKLQIIKETTDKAEDELQWKQDMEDEVEEAQEEHADEYARKMLIYNEQQEKWEKQQEAKREAGKKIKQGRRGSKASKKSKGSKGSKASVQEELGEAELERYQEILNEADLPKPEMPEDFDENAAKDQVKAKFLTIRRRPGEPKLYPELTNTMTVTPSSDCPRGEQNRRDEVSRTKVFIKILFNNKEVSRTGTRPVSQDFRVSFGQIYNLKIVQWPESIKFQIFETQNLSARLLAELYAAIPEASVTSQSVQLEEMEFSSDDTIQMAHEGVGSGVAFKFDATSSFLVTLMTSGMLGTSISWAVSAEGQPLVPPVAQGSSNLFTAMKKVDPLAAIGATGVANMEKLAKWFHESRLDPNDPANADLMYLLGARSGESGAREYFRLEQLQEEFDVATEADLNANRRFQMISLRDREIAEFRNTKMIAPFEREIPRDAFTEYEKKQRDEERQKVMDDIEGVRQAHSRYVQKIREQVIMRFRLASHQKRLEDMVVEEAVPNIAMIGISLLRLSEARRPLKPVRKERKKVTAQAIKGDEVRILVNIIRSTNIPVRKPHHSAGGGAATSRELDRKPTVRNITGETLVHPYVEVMFQRNTVRTSAGEGPNPSFNEELELPLQAPNDDFSPNTLQTVQDSIYLNLFDEVVVDVLEDERERETAIHQRLEKKWLGNIRIPFSTIYLNGKIDGTFRINTPPVLLGYTYDVAQVGDEDMDMPIGQRDDSTYLSLFITIEPPLIQPEPVRERFDTNEDEKLMQYAERWQGELQAMHPRRHYKTSVIDVNGKNVFLTRYFKALKPPTEITEADFAARYVCMIPFVSDAVVFPGLCDIWSSCDQFLQMLAGDEEEHAVMLANLFLGLGKKAYILLGSAIPEGTTAYVLTEEADGYFIWNSSTGKRYSVHDNYCPLQSVGCLVNNENIWANVHQYDKPSQMDFNVNSSATWRPFFSRSNPSPGLGTIQPEALIYHPADKGYVLDLQEKIEQMLKNKIMEWRSRFITRWNRHCTQIMRKLLPKLEENCGRAIDQQDLAELEDSFKTYKVSGFPVNVPFVDLKTIVEAVYSTGVHSQETSDIEFALAVYVHGYSNNVLSIWIYVASLVRLR